MKKISILAVAALSLFGLNLFADGQDEPVKESFLASNEDEESPVTDSFLASNEDEEEPVKENFLACNKEKEEKPTEEDERLA